MTATTAGRPSRVLVVEDDTSLRRAVSAALVADRHEVIALPDGRTVEDCRRSFDPDLAILDVYLPAGPDGFEIGRRLRAAARVPILFVTAADSLTDRLAGFDIGADDYIVKPFAIAELLARVRVALRRAGVSAGPIRVADLVIDETARTVTRQGAVIELTGTEFDLLVVLARHPGRVFSRLQLLSRVWGFDDYDRNLVAVHISALRRKLEARGPRLIHTRRGEGYLLG